MVSRSTRYQGQDVYDRASENSALAEQVQEELSEMYYSTAVDEPVEEGSISSLMGRVEETGEVELACRAEVPTPPEMMSPASEGSVPEVPPAEASAIEAAPAAKRELSFLEKMVMNMRSMFS